jgi:hypothetical protein
MVKGQVISTLFVKLMATLSYTAPALLGSTKTQSGLQTHTAKTATLPSSWWITETWHCLVKLLLSSGAQTHISRSLRNKRRKRRTRKKTAVAVAAVIVQVMRKIMLKTSLSGVGSATVFSKAQNLISAISLSAETVSSMRSCKGTATLLFTITVASRFGPQTHTVSTEICTWLCKPTATWLFITRVTPARTNTPNGLVTLAAWTQTVF